MAVPERTDWTDERLNDWAAEVMMLKSMPIRVGQLAEQVNGMRRELDGFAGRTGQDIAGLGKRFDKFEERLDNALQLIVGDQAEHRGAEKATDRQANRTHSWHIRVSGWLQTVALIAAVVISLASLVAASGVHP